MKRRMAERLISAFGGSVIIVGLSLFVMTMIAVGAKLFETPAEDESIYVIDATGCKQGQRHNLDSVMDRCAVSESVHPVER